ncbi:hypothetical protein PR202_gb25569 [Eleusine coracana subsp. coracana]|uniref:Uncharacterized protein n=1 Tax=Eleusine coracana subsp. coracana TaxID=191504 RepID=A0AAV5FNX6_ELECO|nr:hypothetical protein PR202_gb25569 [Eleusine coracana subsp. coracana]
MSTHNSQVKPISLELEASHDGHVFEVSNYNLHRNLGIGSFLRSATFNVGGCAWCIRFYPSGSSYKAEYEGYITVVTVSYSMGLIDSATSARYAAIEHGKVEFDTRCVKGFVQTWSISTFMRKTELDASTYLHEDRLMIECALRVIEGTRVPPVARPVPKIIDVPLSDLPDHLGWLLKERMGTDVTFEVKDKTFPAHRMLLAARSPVFEAELLGPMKEGSVDRIAIDEIQPEIFDALLHFIYTDSLPDMGDIDDNIQMIGGLLVAADRYAMDRLKLVCEETLSRSLTVENVCDILIIADRHNCSGLKDACIQFMTSDTRDEVTGTEGYARLKRDHPHVLIEALDKAVKLLQK